MKKWLLLLALMALAPPGAQAQEGPPTFCSNVGSGMTMCNDRPVFVSDTQKWLIAGNTSRSEGTFQGWSLRYYWRNWEYNVVIDNQSNTSFRGDSRFRTINCPENFTGSLEVYQVVSSPSVNGRNQGAYNYKFVHCDIEDPPGGPMA